MKNKKKQSSPNKFIIPIVALSILAAIQTTVFIFAYRDNASDYSQKVTSFYYAIENQEYARVTSYYHRNLAVNVNSDEYTEVYTIANYWRDSFHYYALKDIRDVSHYQQRIKEHPTTAGDFQYALDDIDKLFEPYK